MQNFGAQTILDLHIVQQVSWESWPLGALDLESVEFLAPGHLDFFLLASSHFFILLFLQSQHLLLMGRAVTVAFHGFMTAQLQVTSQYTGWQSCSRGGRSPKIRSPKDQPSHFLRKVKKSISTPLTEYHRIWNLKTLISNLMTTDGWTLHHVELY